MALMQLIYVSTADYKITHQDLESIVASSIKYKSSYFVTGMLLFFQGDFMQVLEGEEDILEETFSRICNDPRHHYIFPLIKKPINRREFSRWYMGFNNLNDMTLSLPKKYSSVANDGFDRQKLSETPLLALDLLKDFCPLI